MTNYIHPTAQIASSVELGDSNVIGAFAVILGPARIGDDNWIGPSTILGTPGELRGKPHPRPDEEQGVGLVIGDRNVIRELVTVQQSPTTMTVIGNDCYMMAHTHLPHDAELEDGVTVSCGTHLAGHAWVGEGATLGLGTEVRQRSRIGAYAMIGMNSTVTRHVPPYALVMGSPARVVGVNRVGMERAGIPNDVIDRLNTHYAEGKTDTPEGLPEPVLGHFLRFQERTEAH